MRCPRYSCSSAEKDGRVVGTLGLDIVVVVGVVVFLVLMEKEKEKKGVDHRK